MLGDLRTVIEGKISRFKLSLGHIYGFVYETVNCKLCFVVIICSFLKLKSSDFNIFAFISMSYFVYFINDKKGNVSL